MHNGAMELTSRRCERLVVRFVCKSEEATSYRKKNLDKFPKNYQEIDVLKDVCLYAFSEKHKVPNRRGGRALILGA